MNHVILISQCNEKLVHGSTVSYTVNLYENSMETPGHPQMHEVLDLNR